MKDRTLALAGVFQAAELVRQAATHGTWSGYAADAMLHSLLQLESSSVEDVYGDTDRLRLGLEVMASVLQGEKQHVESLQYVIAILKVERGFWRDGELQQRVGTALEAIGEDENPDAEEGAADRAAEKVAKLYSDTISHLRPRIVVHGKPQYLQAERTVSWIRTLLFAGLRSAFLWRQLGGNRWRLMFGRKRLLADADELLSG